MSSSIIIGILAALAISVAFFLIVRAIVLWYWKIDVIVKNQEEQIALLRQLIQIQSPSNLGTSKSTTLPGSSNNGLTVFTDASQKKGFICSAKDLSTGEMWPAAKNICANYSEGGFNDWRLPTKEELAAIYQTLYKNGIGGFSKGIYWSSTELGIYDATQIDFSNGAESVGGKSSLNIVRAVRTV